MKKLSQNTHLLICKLRFLAHFFFDLASLPKAGKEILSFKQIHLQSWCLYKQLYLKVWPWSFLIAIINSIPIIHNSFISLHIGQPLTIMQQVVSSIGIILLSSFFSAVLKHFIYSIMNDNKASSHQSWLVAKDKMLKIWGGIVLSLILTISGFYLLILPGFIFSILTILWLPILLFENVKVIDAFIISCKWIWPYWYKVLSLIAAPIAIMLLSIFINSILFPRYSLGDIIGGLIIISFIFPYIYIVTLMIYLDLKARNTL